MFCGREYLIDLIGNPGSLSEPDSVLNGPSSISICSPLRLPIFSSVETTGDFRSLAKQYFSDCQSLSIIFADTSGYSLAFLLYVITPENDPFNFFMRYMF